jgi:hypothetical protein
MLVAGIQGNHPGSGAVLHSWLQDILALVSGGAVGLSLSVIGGGGSILAVPLLLYVVGVADVHVAIGTSALAVATSALANFIGHWRVGNVNVVRDDLRGCRYCRGLDRLVAGEDRQWPRAFVPVCSRHDCSQRGYVAVECRW